MTTEYYLITILYLLGVFMTWDWIGEKGRTENWKDLIATIMWPIVAIVGILIYTRDWLNDSN